MKMSLLLITSLLLLLLLLLFPSPSFSLTIETITPNNDDIPPCTDINKNRTVFYKSLTLPLPPISNRLHYVRVLIQGNPIEQTNMIKTQIKIERGNVDAFGVSALAYIPQNVLYRPVVNVTQDGKNVTVTVNVIMPIQYSNDDEDLTSASSNIQSSGSSMTLATGATALAIAWNSCQSKQYIPAVTFGIVAGLSQLMNSPYTTTLAASTPQITCESLPIIRVTVSLPHTFANVSVVEGTISSRNQLYKIDHTPAPTRSPSKSPSHSPSSTPTLSPTAPTSSPSAHPTTHTPSLHPSPGPSRIPSKAPSRSPSRFPSMAPSRAPSKSPSKTPSISKPSKAPSKSPSKAPSHAPSRAPSKNPSKAPKTSQPSKAPLTSSPSTAPLTSQPSKAPTPIGPHAVVYVSQTWIHSDSILSRAHADAVCTSDPRYSANSCTEAHAVISFSTTDDIAHMMQNYPNLNSSVALKGVYNMNKERMATSWPTFISGPLENCIPFSEDDGGIWWSGSFIDGTYDDQHACAGFSGGIKVPWHASSGYGMLADANCDTSQWIAAQVWFCSGVSTGGNGRNLLCACSATS
jgi:hypothetical protein